jgi:hypothetical protein
MKHGWGFMNFLMMRALPVLDPARRDPYLPKFPDYASLHG